MALAMTCNSDSAAYCIDGARLVMMSLFCDILFSIAVTYQHALIVHGNVAYLSVLLSACLLSRVGDRPTAAILQVQFHFFDFCLVFY